MPVSGNPFGVLRRAIEKTVREKQALHRTVGVEVKTLIKEQFAGGFDPSGRAQPATVRGKPALVSKRLGNAIKIVPTATGIEGAGVLKDSRRQWLDAHQEGHTFAARKSTGNRIAFNAKGQRISTARLRTAAKDSKTGVTKRVTIGARESYWREHKNRSTLRGRITNARAHTVGARVLPQRMIYPFPSLGPRWGGRIRLSLEATLAKKMKSEVNGG